MNSRRIALDILREIEEGAYSNYSLNKRLRKISDKRERSLITELVYGVLRQQKRLDYLISWLSNRALNRLDRVVLLALRLGLYQLEFLNRIPDRAAVNETVNSLKGLINKGGLGFVNALLRNYIRKREKISYPDPEKDPESFLANYYSHPDWLVRMWLKQYGFEKTSRLCRSNNRPAGLVIRRNSLKYNEDEFLAGFAAVDVDIELKKLSIPDAYIVNKINKVEQLPLYREGGFIVQGAAAILASWLLLPCPGARVLDMAAGPGGKTTHLAELMNNQGSIIALDIFDHKLKLIEENCRRLGVEIVKLVKMDGRIFSTDNKFDYILLDAPCSGLGLLANKPEIKWNKSIVNIKELSSIQLEMLNNAFSLLKVGGFLLYSTCTLSYQENQAVVEEFLKIQENRVRLMDINKELEKLAAGDKFQASPEGWLELFPPESGTEGFFIAKFQKLEEIFNE